MANPGTFSLAFTLYRSIMIHATGNPAQILAVSVAAGVVFVAACVGCGVKSALSEKE